MMKSRLINILLVLLLVSCKSIKSQTATGFIKKYAPSHNVKNETILSIVNKKTEFIDNSLYDVIIMKIDSMSPEKQDVYIKVSNFNLEQKYCFTSLGCDKPDGYLIINKIPVLLYGNLGVFFNRKRETKDILKSNKKDLILLEMDGEYSLYQYQSHLIDSEAYENIVYKGDFSSRQVRERLK